VQADPFNLSLSGALADHRAGRWGAADQAYTRLRQMDPGHFEVHHLSGALAYQQRRFADAVQLLSRARELNPRSALCAMRLGLALMEVREWARAEERLKESVRLGPDVPEAWEHLALCLKLRGRLPEAIACQRQAAARFPSQPAAWCNLGLSLVTAGQPEEALACQARSLAIDPAYVPARFARAQALQHLNDVGGAIADYRSVLALQPNHHAARSCLLFALHYVDGPAGELWAEHQAYGRAFEAVPGGALPQQPDPQRRLRVALLSPDLRSHACAFFLAPLLRHLDAAAFEIVLYHDHFVEDAMTALLRRLARVAERPNAWRNFVNQTDAQVESLIRADAPDILVDLAGHTGMSCRLPALARRLAPVQINYLGYPDTTGLRQMDYRFTDAVADPEPEADRFASERLVRFSCTAWAYEPPADAPEPSGAPPSASGDPVTFGSFNHPGKITDAGLRIWAGILASVEGSRLFLKGPGVDRPDFIARLEAAGIPRARALLSRPLPAGPDHLRAYHRVDIALDAFPYNGTTTTCEALWMGVPVVTLAGDRHSSRVGASLLTAIGRPEWIARTASEYAAVAVGLARDRPRLAEARSGLRSAMQRSDLLAHSVQARRFGDALRQCWAAWCARAAVG
jgi:predicted O-linked N-acetylglucosamine transferase (SPINDLY family)